jgi:hypothetical protein
VKLSLLENIFDAISKRDKLIKVFLDSLINFGESFCEIKFPNKVQQVFVIVVEFLEELKRHSKIDLRIAPTKL